MATNQEIMNRFHVAKDAATGTWFVYGPSPRNPAIGIVAFHSFSRRDGAKRGWATRLGAEKQLQATQIFAILAEPVEA